MRLQFAMRCVFPFMVALFYVSAYPSLVGGQDYSEIIALLTGAKIIAQDDENTYLGKIASEFDGDSIFNEFGKYGSHFSSQSIWNEFGTFGSEFSSCSPFNKFTTKPPMIIKNGKILGYLSANKSIKGSISPNLLKAIMKDE
jgi:hypothetical protein